MLKTRSEIWRNGLTYTGGIMTLLAVLFMLSFLFFDLVAGGRNPYLGLFTYLVFPVIFVVGLVILLAGFLVTRARIKRLGGFGPNIHYLPRINLSDPTHRRVLIGIGAVSGLSLPVIGVLSYNGYHYTESNEFCGKVCHEVMEPEYTAFLDSPHARVGCAECHIGSGASWYVKSKLSGLRQVWAVTVDSFSRPIPRAIQELRPARETCEQCHWPSKFFGDQLRTVDLFASDEKNSHQQLKLLMKTGGADPTKGPPSGIHWHMALGFTIDYIAVDEGLQEIPWVRMRDHQTGRQTTYRADGLKSTDPAPEGIHRTVDCMDCHNRPTHVFRSPSESLDALLNLRPEFRDLPFAKREAVNALVDSYTHSDEAVERIKNTITSFYRDAHPQVWSNQYEVVNRFIDAVSNIYRTNFFPKMKVDWTTYPNNIGHMTSPGCFRCHDGKHMDDQGQIIRNDCSVCHDFLVPAAENEHSLIRTGGFEHPMPLKGNHATLRCDQCHSGGPAPVPTCTGCHSDVDAFRQGTTPEFAKFGIQADSMARQVDCEACHDLTKPVSVESIGPLCFECHEDDGEEYEGMLAAWEKEILDRLNAAEQAGADPSVLDALKRAGPFHNFEASKTILNAITGKPASTQANDG